MEEKKKREVRSITTYLTLSAVAAAFVGAFVWGGTRDFERTAIWTAITFIVSLVGIATLALSVKDDDQDPNQPRLK